MLLYLAQLLESHCRFFAVFNYITLRCILGAMSALLITLVIGPTLIQRLVRYQIGQSVRLDGPQDHLRKSGTPTMGGILILISVLISTLLWAKLTHYYIWVVMLTTVLFSIVGFLDDYFKLVLRNSKGLSARKKLAGQLVIATVVAVFLFLAATHTVETRLIVPFFKNYYLDLGWMFIPFTILVLVGTSNAVNLTDGLDGLAILPIVMIAGAFGIFAYASGNLNFAKYLLIPYIPEISDVAIFCSSIVGAGLGFLWFNTYPAQIFMGDVGSLGLGAALGIIAVTVRQELILLLMGGVFVAETLSVIIQVTSFRLRGKRVFKMAPLHHHFELMGWPEPRVIVRFWIITFVLVLLGLSSLKIR